MNFIRRQSARLRGCPTAREIPQSRTGRKPTAEALYVRADQTGGQFEPPDGQVFFHGSAMRGVDFSGTTFYYFSSRGAMFESCNFSRVRFDSGFLASEKPSLFVDCRFDQADLRAIDPAIGRFERCSFGQARIRNWRSDCAEFVDCTFGGPIVGTLFSGRPAGAFQGWVASRTRNEFLGNDFRDAELIDCAFSGGIDVGLQRWPEHPDFVLLDHWPERYRKAKEHFEREADAPKRAELLSALAAYSRLSSEADLVAWRTDVRLPPSLSEQFWSALGRGTTYVE